MNNESDSNLKLAFQSLKAGDSGRLPDFEIPGPGSSQSRWKIRWELPVSAVAIVLAAGSFFLFLKSPTEDDFVAGIRFDELSEMVSREAFVSKAEDWKAPTDFLLNLNLEPQHLNP